VPDLTFIALILTSKYTNEWEIPYMFYVLYSIFIV